MRNGVVVLPSGMKVVAKKMGEAVEMMTVKEMHTARSLWKMPDSVCSVSEAWAILSMAVSSL